MLHELPAAAILRRKAREGLDFVRNRFPHRSEIISVLSAAAFVCHGWSLLSFFNKLSSFILRFTLAEISEIFAFMMAFAFLESLVITAFLAGLSAVLPSTWLKDGFASKALVVIVVLTMASLGFQKFLTSSFPSPVLLLSSCLLPLVLIGLLLFLTRSYSRLQQLLAGIQDRLSIMLYIYVPLGVLSLLYIMSRYLL